MSRRKKTVAGFSLAELCMTMFLLFLLSALGLLSMKHGTHDAYAKAMATELTSQMRLAQARAIATQTPVGLTDPVTVQVFAHAERESGQ